MKIVCCFGGDAAQAAPWVADLQAALPSARVSTDDRGADYAVVWRPPADFLVGQTSLKAVFAAGAGVDALLALPWPAGVPLVRLEDAGMGAQMAEYVVHALLRAFRRFDAYAEQQQAGRWAPLPAERREHWPVGLLGHGMLGRAVGDAVRALGFPVVAWTRTARAGAGPDVFAGADGLDDFLARTRVLVDLLPLTDATRDLIDASLLAKLRPGAHFINVARGAHVVEADLLAALSSGRLAGATLDVCRDEPAPPHHAFWSHPKVVLTPHVAAQTLRPESVAQIVRGIKAFERGEAVAGVVERDRGY